MKTWILIVLVCLSLGSFAQVAGPFDASSFDTVSLSGSVTGRLNPDSAATSDNNYVSIPLNGLSASGNYTNYFRALDFGFFLSAGATVDGILVEVERTDVNNAKDNAVRIVKGGTIGTTVNP
jgi:hypothetical protein